MKTANIFDAIAPTLDQKVFKGEVPRPRIIKFIYDNIQRVLGSIIPDPLLHFQLFITGSLTTYQYNDTSDMDISYFPDYDYFMQWFATDDTKEIRTKLIEMVIGQLDGKFIPGTQHPLQDFIVPPDIYPQDLFKPGIRSAWDIKNHMWFVAPEHDRVVDVATQLPVLYQRAQDMADKMKNMLDHDPVYAKLLYRQIHMKRSLDEKNGKGDFCLAPGTRILTSTYEWKPIEELHIGDTLIGFDEYPEKKEERRGTQRLLRETTVISMIKKNLPSYRIITDRNTNTVASEDHMWLVRGPKRMLIWKTTGDLREGDKIIRFGDVWNEANDPLEAAYLGGLFDGEGHISDLGRLSFSQREGLVMERGKDALDCLGFKYSSSKSHQWLGKHNLLSNIQVFGGVAESMRFLYQVPTVRLRSSKSGWWIGRSISPKGINVEKGKCYATVQKIDYLGSRLVIGVGTTSKTLIADGLYSHNSEGNVVYKYLLHQGLFDRIRNELGIYIAKVSATDIFERAAHIIAESQRAGENGVAVGLKYLADNGYDISILNNVRQELSNFAFHIAGPPGFDDQYIFQMRELLASQYQKTANNNLADKNIKVIYDFENDRIILGTEGNKVPPGSKIIGEYDGQNVSLYSTGEEFINIAYFKRLWTSSFPTRTLKSVLFEGQDLPTRQIHHP